MSAILLDTCAVIWIGRDEGLAAEAEAILNDCWARNEAVNVSPISAWEIGLLVARGRLSLNVPPTRWFARFIASPGIQVIDLDPSTLVESSFLPGTPPNDPADRILAATARDRGWRLMTRDRLLLGYAEAGHIGAVLC